MQKKLHFLLQTQNLLKLLLQVNDPNWGRIIMAIGKSDVDIDIKKTIN